MKRLRVVAAVLLVCAIVCAGGVWAILEALRPERAAPELAARPRPHRVTRNTAGAGAGDALPAEAPVEEIAPPEPGELLVWCAGLADDSCAGFLIQCTTALAPMGNSCLTDPESGATYCRCPTDTDEVAVRGGGRATLTDPNAGEAWLDFRDTGTLVGRVTRDGAAPAGCQVLALRVPDALEDLPRGLFVGRERACEPDGSFRVDGLVEGDWELSFRTGDGAGAWDERVLVPRRVRPGAVVDVGVVAVPGGAAIEGTVTDGVTGAPASEAMIFAIRDGAAGERVTIQGDETNADGTFRVRGLPPGTWTVAPALAPQAAVTVTVHGDETVRGVHIVTSDATALEENGFALGDEDGRLVVTDVTRDTPAWDAGLETGDEVVGVRVAGFDVASALGSRGPEFARAVLGYWDGPGVTLVVKAADGGEELVPLDW